MKARAWVSFLVVAAVSILGLFLPSTTTSLNSGDPINGADTGWVIVASALVLIMTPGLGFFYGGMASKKNAISTVFQSVVCLGVISVLWVFVGFSLCFGESIGGIIGDPRTFLMFNHVGFETNKDLSPTIPLVLYAMFQLKFAIITPALITGSFAERVKFSSYLLFICLFSLFIYAPLAHMTWHPDGLLRKWGVLDFAGGTVVHMSAGFAALAGAIFLGKRKVMLNVNHAHEASNIPRVIIGTGLLWFGWFGFNAGSALAANGTAAMSLATTNTAAAAAMLTWLFLDNIRGNKASAMGGCIGAVVGLVAITPACGYVNVGQAMFIGFISSIISYYAVHLKNKTGLDDTLDVFPCHGMGGIVGTILTGVFAANVGIVYDIHNPTFFKHLATVVIVGVFAFGGSMIFYKITDMLVPMRVTPEEELMGLDLSQHGERMLDS
ncbi:MAG: ammonium transporter [Chitinophagales bacterium]|nr:ammonium transporter [Chitinophagales bacterium]